jgi:hypothetical protein
LHAGIEKDSFIKRFFSKQLTCMKNIKEQAICLAIFFLINQVLLAQARVIINGGIIKIENNTSLVIDNPQNTAITFNGSGYIQSEGAGNQLIWSIGSAGGDFLIPFGNATGYFPLQFSATSGTGNGQFIFSTYPANTWKNSDALPPGVTNVNNNGLDNSAKMIDRFWQINPQGYTTNPTINNLVFTYGEAEYGAPNTITENNLVAQRWNSSAQVWGDYFPASIINTAANTVTLPTVPGNQLYNWWTLTDLGSPLPVTLLDFTAIKKNNTVITNWSTSTEINSAYFELWKSADQQVFEKLGSVAAAGFSSTLLKYSFTDSKPLNGTSYYRLKMVDADGKFVWSPTVRINVGNDNFVSIFPNPATAFINLSVSSAIAGAKPTGYVYNGLGSLVKTFPITGTYKKINIELLPPGLYSVRFAYNKNSFTFLFIKK